MTDDRRLFVLWREPTDDGHRHIVGDLREADGQFHFAYASDLAEAKARGFQPFIEFPDEHSSYSSRYLFPTFSQRIPSPARPDFRRLLQSWGVERPDDRMEILAKSGGLQVTDRVELAWFRGEGSELVEPLEFRVAGARHRTHPPPLEIGACVVLRCEPDNPVDPHAVSVEDEHRERAGYVPRQYSALVARMLRAGAPHSARVVRHLLEPDSPTPRAVVRIEPAAAQP